MDPQGFEPLEVYVFPILYSLHIRLNLILTMVVRRQLIQIHGHSQDSDAQESERHAARFLTSQFIGYRFRARLLLHVEPGLGLLPVLVLVFNAVGDYFVDISKHNLLLLRRHNIRARLRPRPQHAPIRLLPLVQPVRPHLVVLFVVIADHVVHVFFLGEDRGGVAGHYVTPTILLHQARYALLQAQLRLPEMVSVLIIIRQQLLIRHVDGGRSGAAGGAGAEVLLVVADAAVLRHWVDALHLVIVGVGEPDGFPLRDIVRVLRIVFVRVVLVYFQIAEGLKLHPLLRLLCLRTLARVQAVATAIVIVLHSK